MYCLCGCGVATKPHTKNNARKGHIIGVPRAFLSGHNRRAQANFSKCTSCDKGYLSPCLEWNGAVSHGGYGRLKSGGRMLQAHRLSYELSKGPIPGYMQIDHLCRNRRCVEPTHLEAVTCAENIRRGLSTKLAVRDVLAIREDARSPKQVGKDYNVTARHIRKIREGKRWSVDVVEHGAKAFVEAGGAR